MQLEYLIIYRDTGIPVYSRCFGNICKRVIADDILFSAFLSSIQTFATIDKENMPMELDLDGTVVEVNFDQEDGVNSIRLDEMELMFFFSEIDGITITTGFNAEEYDRGEAIPIFKEFIAKLDNYLQDNHQQSDWSDISSDVLTEFEQDLLRDIIYPFFEIYHIDESCKLGENCPFRVAIYEEEGSIFDRMRNKITEYRNLNIFSKIKKMLTASKFPLFN